MNWTKRALSIGLLFAVVFCATGWAGEPTHEPAEVLQWFADRWDEKDWANPSPQKAYMRPLDDRGWQARMLAMQRLARSGKDAVGPLLEAFQNGDVPTRILAAQTLGYLAPHVSRDVLRKGALADPHPAVRLYAVDSLGMQGGADLASALAALEKTERNRDVKRHIAYAKERRKQGVDARVIQALVDWDPSSLHSAKIGRPAPDFSLQTVSGRKVRLSQYRGKQPVVLVFIYGDT